MSSRLRNLDSRISFFAFADIITAVSGVLIFVALLLATDLGRPAGKQAQPANPEAEQELQDTLAQQQEVVAANHRLEELLAAADTAPDADKLRADIARLRSQLAAEQKKQAAAAGEMAGSQVAIAARDKALGLTDIKAEIEKIIREAEGIENQTRQAKDTVDGLEQQVAREEARLLKLRERDGQIWLIPERSMTTKEPILVTVSGAGVTVEHFDRPADRQQVDATMADIALGAFLETNKVTDVYVVFLIRPSGIGLFNELVATARDRGFEVGYDALEEDRQVHFSTPPPIEEPVAAESNGAAPTVQAAPQAVSANGAGSAPAAGESASAGAPATIAKPVPAPKPAPPVAQPQSKSWWQRLCEWLGVK